MNKKLLTITIITLASISLYIHTNNNYGQWFITEQEMLNTRKYQIAQEYWNCFVTQNTNHDHALIQHVITTRSTSNNKQEIILDSFNKAIETKNFDIFASLISTVDDFGISIIQAEEHLSTPFKYSNFYPCKENPLINPTDIQKLKKYIYDSNFSGVASIHSSHYIYCQQ